jgi:UDP-N-acetylglucosamine 1-carboxyvinyltransferase
MSAPDTTSVAQKLAEIRLAASQKLIVSPSTEIAGEAHVQGSKNAANKLIGVAVALPGRYVLKNFPFILDPLELLGIVELLGGEVKLLPDNTVSLDTTAIENAPIPYSLTKNTTGAFGFAGALLGRFGGVEIGKPGGDKIGPRPVDLHVDALRALGAEITETPEVLYGQMKSASKAESFRLTMPSTGAAVNFILAAVASKSKARLENAPQDGDMDAMHRLIKAAGVALKAENNTVEIDATEFNPSGKEIIFTCSPDKNDAFTWLAYGALSRKGLRISGLKLSDLTQGVNTLESLGVQISKESDGSFLVQAPSSENEPKNITVIAGLAREFHSDWAPFLEVIATTIRGRCRVVDTLFSHRVRQAELLGQMGARVNISGGTPPDGIKLRFKSNPQEARYIIDVEGPTKLRPIDTEVGYDLRACAAIVMAASQADGVSTLSNMQALYRGYEDIVDRLRSVGVNITAN